MRLIISLFILLFSLSFSLSYSLSVQASQSSIRFERLSIKEGLSISAISSIRQDRLGYLWFGTEDGLNRYDGYEFVIYKHDTQDADSLLDNWINTLYIDAGGILWIGTKAGLNRYDPQSDSFVAFKSHPQDDNSLAHDVVRSITQDSEGILWVGTEGGLSRFDATSGQFTNYRFDESNSGSLSNNTIRSVFIDNKGTVWVGTDGGGLNRFDPTSQRFVRYTNNPGDTSSISSNSIWAIHQDSAGNLWVGTQGGGVNRFNLSDERFVRYTVDANNPTSLSHADVKTIFEDASGVLWIGTESGLNRYNPQNQQFSVYKNIPVNPTSLSHNDVRAIFADVTGILWVGTGGGGVSKYDPKQVSFRHFKHEPSNQGSLSNSIVKGIHKDSKGRLWVGTGDGLNRYDSQKDQFIRYAHQEGNPNSLSHNVVSSIFEDGQGKLWMGTLGGGLNLFDSQTQQFTHYQPDETNPWSLSHNRVNTIREDASGKLWVGTDDGLNRFDQQTGRFIRYNTSKTPDDGGLSHKVITALLLDDSGGLWVGTVGGLNKYDDKTDSFSAYTHEDGNSDSISHNVVTSFLQDSQRRIWVGTVGGLNLFDPNSGKFKSYRKRDGLPNDVVYGILEDPKGLLWMSTNGGISKFDVKKEIFKNYTAIDGLQSNEFNFGSYFRSDDGEMFFGGIEGLNSFFAENISEYTRKPEVVLTNFLLLNKTVPIASSIDTRDDEGGKRPFSIAKSINALEQLTLDYTQSLFSFQFAALDYTDSMNNGYAYKLQGWDNDWIYTDANNRRATYTNIPAGDYTLRVKASNKDGYWNEQGKSLNITIEPAPWETWWAYTIYGLCVLAMIAGFVRGQRRKERFQHQKILNQEAVNQQLQQVDKLKDEFLANTSHELRTPLNGIIGLAESLIDGATGNLPDSTNRNLAMIVDSGKRLANLVNDILDFSKLKSKDIPLNLKAIDLRTAVEVTLAMSAVLVRGKTLAFINEIPEDLSPAHADEDKLQQILFNLLGNAIKFTDSGTVTVTAFSADGVLSVNIIDSGIGIALDKQDSIFESFEQADSSATRQYGGTGLGLTVTRQLVELHGGTISVASQEGEGSTFTFTLPVSDESVSESGLTPQLTQLSEITADSQQMVQEVQMPTLSTVTLDDQGGEGNRPFYVLLVDDEPINLQVLKNHFIGLNYHVTTALSGEQALNHVDGEVRFDLVLLDVMMPKMSGYEVAIKIRETRKAHELPIIMLTAKNQVADLVEGFSCGANDYLAKPFSKDELLARIKTQLNLVKINSASARFFPSEFLSMLSRDSIVDVRLGDQIQSEMTILFLDIRAFTLLSENMTPKENFDFLNEYLSYVIPSINDNNGFIDKYIGDAVMALFPVCADDAVKAAVAILRKVEQYNELRIEREQQTISIGIGLHTGNLMLGTIGNDQRMDGTVISDAVNLASRLEGLTKTYGTSLVVSDRCFEKLSPDHPFNHRSLGRVQVKGKDKVIGVIEIMDGESEQVLEAKKSTLESFERGLKNYFDRDFEESARAFKQVLKLNPDDQTALMYHKRSATYMVNGVGAKWDGTERMDSK